MSKYNQPSPKNEGTLVYIDGKLIPRELAKISVLDSLVQGGDGVWEGLRVYKGKIFQFNEHISRLLDSAKALYFSEIPTKQYVENAVFSCLKANNMFDGVHIRLTLSRGLKTTSGMNPDLNIYGCTLIVLPEYKPPVYGDDGIRLVTASVRRNSPSCLDSKIHHNNLINNILAKIEANFSGVDDALMLDVDGMVSETNATNVFYVNNGELFTPFPDSCLPGLTRAKVIEISKALEISCFEKRCSLSEFYCADEVFTTGTMGELSHVVEIDGRSISNGKKGPVTLKLQNEYAKRTESFGVEIPKN